MELENACRNCLELTDRVRSALADGDVETAAALVPQRGDALQELGSRLAAASPARRDELRGLLSELATADAALKALGDQVLEETAVALRNSAGTGPVGGDSPPRQACIDRTA